MSAEGLRSPREKVGGLYHLEPISVGATPCFFSLAPIGGEGESHAYRDWLLARTLNKFSLTTNESSQQAV